VSPSASPTAASPSRWYPRAFVEVGTRGCVYDRGYESVPWMAAEVSAETSQYLFGTREECCEAWSGLCGGAAAASTAVQTAPPTPSPSASPADPLSRWYPRAFVEVGTLGCSHGRGYESVPWMAAEVSSATSQYLFGTREECCEAWLGHCDDTASTVTTSTASPDSGPGGIGPGDATPPEFHLFGPCDSNADCADSRLLCQEGECRVRDGEACETGRDREQCAQNFVCDAGHSPCESERCPGVCACASSDACPGERVCADPFCGLVPDAVRECSDPHVLDMRCNDFYEASVCSVRDTDAGTVSECTHPLLRRSLRDRR